MLQKQSELIAENVENRHEPKEAIWNFTTQK